MTISGDGKTVTLKLAQDTDAVHLNAVTTYDSITVTYQANKSPAVRLDTHVALLILPSLVVMTI